MRTWVTLAVTTLSAACSRPVDSTTQSRIADTEQFTQQQLRTGDIILVPLNCYVCNAIEAETGVTYSHSVIVAETSEDSRPTTVYEAWGSVKKTPLSEISARKQKNQSLFVVRPRQFIRSGSPSAEELRKVFDDEYSGLPFDDEYLWTNTDEQGREKLYCSEFAFKFINRFLREQLTTAPMDFSRNFEFWIKYYAQFGMKPPSGEPGASPATLFNSTLVKKIGELTTPAQ
ncbi:MAG: hypothetical protein RLZZ488_2757 [Pseudomonadota bacterium]|jgi:hypothetical protein